MCCVFDVCTCVLFGCVDVTLVVVGVLNLLDVCGVVFVVFGCCG